MSNIFMNQIKKIEYLINREGIKMIERENVAEYKKLAEFFDLNIKITKDIIEKIRKAHFEEGLGIPQMREKLKNELFELGWLPLTKSKTISKRFIPGISKFISIILGY